jgi:hypothetical protein
MMHFASQTLQMCEHAEIIMMTKCVQDKELGTLTTRYYGFETGKEQKSG